jgi:hypothetical protein
VLPGDASEHALPAQGPQLGFYQGNARHSISGDGSRVVFTAGGAAESERHLYLREHANQPQSPIGPEGECLVAADACTVQLDAGLSGSPQFQTANAEVTRIFFTDGEAEDRDRDLYEYNLESAELVRLTVDASVVGSVIGASEDGSRIYFSGNGALSPHAVTGNCRAGETEKGGCNLYMMHYDGAHWQAPQLIAVLSGVDGSDWASDSSGYPALAARVSPNGRWLAFMSLARLTGYDNRDSGSGEPDSEVYEFDAATSSLICVSCNPTGERPHGLRSEQIDTANGGIAGGHVMPFPPWVAANLPGWTPNITSSVSTYQSRYLSDSGRLFFNSSDVLAPKDSNDTEDVYEYEPQGVPAGERACSPASQSGSVSFKPARSHEVEGLTVTEEAGCVGLISSGESANESAFLDADETGSEVFFLTSARLLPQDSDTSFDVYDARECTASSPCLTAPASVPPPCETEASCRPAPTPQPLIFGPSGSATFSGPGNLLAPFSLPPAPKPLTSAQKLARALHACKKHKNRKQRAACIRKARHRYSPHTSPSKHKRTAARRGQ